MGELNFLIAACVVALYGFLMLGLGSGLLQGFSRRTVTGFELMSRFLRLVLLFNVLVYLVTT